MSNSDKFFRLIPVQEITDISFNITDNTESLDPVKNYIISYFINMGDNDKFRCDIQAILLKKEYKYHLLGLEKNKQFIDLNATFDNIYSDTQTTNEIVSELNNLIKEKLNIEVTEALIS